MIGFVSLPQNNNAALYPKMSGRQQVVTISLARW